MSSKSKCNGKRFVPRIDEFFAYATKEPPGTADLYTTPETQRIRDIALAAGVSPYAVFIAIMDALGDGIGLPNPTTILGAPDAVARVRHIADQLAAEMLESLP
jgi:hypothetical protein